MNEPQRHVDNRIDETLMMLRAAAIEQGMAVSGDNRVGEDPGPEVAKPVSTLSMFSVEPTMPSPGPWGRHEAVHATSSAAEISIVFAAGNGPVADGIVASLNRPGGNITGITSIASELGSKRLGLLRELLPDIRTISLQAVVLVVPRVRIPLARDSRRSANLMTVAVAVHRDGNCGQLPFLKFICGPNATLRA